MASFNKVILVGNLTRDPLAEIDRICKFLSLRVSPADRAAAVQNTSEKTLMAMEEQEIQYKMPGLFANLINGGSRKWRFVRDSSLEPVAELVPPALLARAAEALATPAKQFGYE